MYEFAMDGVQQHLVKKSQMARLTYTSELIPERSPDGQMYVLRFVSLIASHHVFRTDHGDFNPNKTT